jgi:choice-of-anchor B domain-containing protein
MRIAATAVAAMLLCGGTAAQAQNYAMDVAASEGIVFVAESQNRVRPGTVYAYRAGADGQWVELAKLTAPDGRGGDGFGNAIAASGTILVVAQAADGEGRGAVHVFERRDEAWQHTTRLVAGDGAAGDNFGGAVAVAGDAILVGATGAGGAGAAYVFRRGANGWTQEAKLTASNAAAGDGFGGAVAVAGTRALVGAPAQAESRGGAYLFDRGPSGWTETAHMVARTVSAGDGLGARVALLRDYAVVAAPGRDENTGAVYLFEKNPQADGWAAFTRLFPYEGGSNSQFGASLNIVDGELWIGSPGADGFAGTVYRFGWDDERNDWTAVRKLSWVGGPPGTGFSMAVAVAGGTAVAGAPGYEQGGGGAVVLTRTGLDWEAVSVLSVEPESFPAVTGDVVPCASGQAALFACDGVELLSFLPISDIGGSRGVTLNDIWGWTDPTTNREYALVGRSNGTSFVDVTDAANPRYLGDLPMTAGSQANAWRDIKVYRDHAYIVADGAGKHGVQIFDLTRLRDVQGEPVTFTEDALYDRVYSAHNIVINEASGTAYAVGSNSGGDTCGGGLHMIDIREPKNPTFAGCFSDPRTGNAGTGYSHDAQCVAYSGPHEKYAGREICFGSNETALSIADVTDRANPVALSRASYPNVQYSHQGWLTDDQRFFYMNDEGDEISGVVPRTRTIIWDVSDLDDPQFVGEFLGTTAASDHNLYIVGDTMYQSNYEAGLRIIDISDRMNPREVGHFDSVPGGDNSPGFEGSWSNYPYFRSGAIIFTSIREGLFVVRMQRPIS